MTASHLMHTYAPNPVSFARGEGVWLWDVNGKKYLDALSGIAVSGLGHAHPVFTKAINEQAERLQALRDRRRVMQRREHARDGGDAQRHRGGASVEERRLLARRHRRNSHQGSSPRVRGAGVARSGAKAWPWPWRNPRT